MHSTAREWSPGPRAGHGSKAELVPSARGTPACAVSHAALPARSSDPDGFVSIIISCSAAPGAAACHGMPGPSHHSQDTGILGDQGLDAQSYKSRLKYPQSLEGLETLLASDLTKALIFLGQCHRAPLCGR